MFTIRSARRLAMLMMFVGGALTGQPNAAAEVINFNSLVYPPSFPAANDGTAPAGLTYSEAGFTLDYLGPAGGQFNFIHHAPTVSVPSFINRFSDSVSFYNNGQLGVTRLTKTGGGSFDLESIDLDALNPVSSGGPFDVSRAVLVTFIGTRPDLTTVTQSFITDTVFPGRQTFTFSASFDDVIKVEWVQGNNSLTQDAPHQFDNIVVNANVQPIPEPATLALLGLGVVGLAMMRRKRMV